MELRSSASPSAGREDTFPDNSIRGIPIDSRLTILGSYLCRYWSRYSRCWSDAVYRLCYHANLPWKIFDFLVTWRGQCIFRSSSSSALYDSASCIRYVISSNGLYAVGILLQNNDAHDHLHTKPVTRNNSVKSVTKPAANKNNIQPF